MKIAELSKNTPSDDGIMHDRLVRLVFEVAVPSRFERTERSLFNLLDFFLCGPKLDAGFNTVGGERASAISVPLGKDLLLDCRVSTDEVVKGLAIRLRAEY